MCRSTLNVNEVTTQPDQEGEVERDDEFYIDSIDPSARNPCESTDQTLRYLDLGPGRVPIKFKHDTGSQVNILPVRVRLFKGIGSLSSPKQPSKHLYDYSKSCLESLGEQKIRCAHGNRVREVDFFIVETDSVLIFGLKSCVDLQLNKLVMAIETLSPTKPTPVMRNHLDNKSGLSEYKDVFEGIGLFPDECDILIDENATTVLNSPRRTKFALREKLQIERERMEKSEVITRVTEPNKSVNSLANTEKLGSGKLRVCLNPRDLNQAILRPHYLMKTLEDIISNLTGVRYFFKTYRAFGLLGY